MAPRTRSNRTEILERRKLLASGVSTNTHGLPALPNELYLEILIHLPAIPIPQEAWIDKDPDAYRQLTLYYLSQTCRSLRKFFLRYAWERIEVFGGMWTPKGRLATQVERNKCGTGKKELIEKQLVEEVVRQLETVVVRNPDLRQYVSTVSLTLLRHSHDSVLPEIAQNLSLFPNLHTLRLIFCFYYPVDPWPPLFSAYRYPNVHTLDISHMGPRVDILRACPNTKHLSFFKDDGEFHLWYLSVSECAGGLETLGVLMGLEYSVAAVVKCLPRLRDLSLDSQNLRSCPNLNLLSSLPLQTLRLLLDTRPLFPPSSVTPATPEERQRWIDLAKGILVNCPQHDPKRVIVMNFDKTVDIYYV